MRLSTLTKKNRNAKGWKMKWFLFAFIMLIVIYFLIQGIRCIIGYHKAQEKLNSLEVKTASLSYGPMTYIDQGRRGRYSIGSWVFLADMIRPMKV